LRGPARVIVFGGGEAGDLTPADDEAWLQRFRRNYEGVRLKTGEGNAVSVRVWQLTAKRKGGRGGWVRNRGRIEWIRVVDVY